MPEALQQVREDLGEEAVILSTRSIRKNSRFNPQGESRVEVTAAFDRPGDAPGDPMSARLRATPLAARKYAPVRKDPPAGGAPESPARLAEELKHLREVVQRLERRAPQLLLPESVQRLAERLRRQGLDQELANRLLQALVQEMEWEALEDRARVGARAAALLAGLLPPCRDIKIGRQRKVIGFVGASGAGKTTAAAKIAAGFAAKRRSDRGAILLVSTDARRVGALDQARAFAQIIGVPLEVAYDEEEVQAVLGRHPQARLVLVDTAGCGPHEHREWECRRRLLEAAGADQVQVVLDGLTGLEHMLDVVEASRVFAERRLLFAKMDEVVRPGAALSAAVHSRIPTSYLVVGPTPPGGIEAGNMAQLAAELVGAELAARGEHT